MAELTGVCLSKAQKNSTWLQWSLFRLFVAILILFESIGIKLCCWKELRFDSMRLQRYTSPSSEPQITWSRSGLRLARRWKRLFLLPLIFIMTQPVRMLTNLTLESFVVIMQMLRLQKSMPVTLRPPENFPVLFLTSIDLSSLSFSAVKVYCAPAMP